jgi:anaerobic selenocysteine-containing dehydrogenase
MAVVPLRSAPSPTTRFTACNLCEAICGLVLTVEDGRVTSARGNPDDPLSRGHICPKGVALADVHADPDRLRRPVRRTAHGWEEIGWDEAFDMAADGLAGTMRAYGRDAVAVYAGNPNVHSLGGMTHLPALLRTLGSRNVYSASSVDQLPSHLVSRWLYGHQLLIPVPDIDRTQLFVVVGANPMASNGSLMTVPDFPGRLRELRARGGRMVVLDPRRTETARAADEHVFIRPGTDAFVLLAMVRTLFDEDLASPAPYVDGVGAVREAVAAYTPERAEAASGVPAVVVRRLAREVAESEAAAVYGRTGVSTQEFGLVCQWAVQALNVLSGNLDRAGGTMFTRPAVDVVGRGLASRGGHGRWRSRVRGLPESNGELPVATLADEILTPGEGQVRALLTVAGNPVLSTPGGARLGQALAGLDFMVAVDPYLNETTRHAHVVLPPTTHLERDHYDLAFHVLAVRNTARFSPAVFDKPAGARHDHEIFRELALRTMRRGGSAQPWSRRLRQEVRLRLGPTFIVDVLLRTGGTGLSLRRLRSHPEGVDLGPLRPCLPDRLATSDQRVRLATPQVLTDLGRLDEAASVSLSAEELLLIGRRHQRDCNSWLHNTERLTKGRPRHRLLMHPRDLAQRGIAGGSQARVRSRAGSVLVEVEASEDVMPGVVSLPHGYGHAQATTLSRASTVPGVSVNDLTDAAVVDASGNAVLNGVPVTVEAAQPPG